MRSCLNVSSVTKALKPYFDSFPFPQWLWLELVFPFLARLTPADVSFSTRWLPALCPTTGKWQFPSHLQHSDFPGSLLSFLILQFLWLEEFLSQDTA